MEAKCNKLVKIYRFGAYTVVLISSKKQVEKRSDRGRLSRIGSGELFEAEMNS